MEKKRIWIVTELFHPEETAVAFIFTRIANFLSNNYEVCVICGPEFYDNNKVNFTDNYQISDDIKIYRTKTLTLDKNSLIQRTFKVIFLSFQMSFLMINKIQKGEIVLLATNPAPLLISAGLIKRWKKIQLHILVHDVFPENTIPAQIFKHKKSITYRLIKTFFDRAYAKADHLIAIGRDMKDVLFEKTKRFNKNLPISVVTNWSNPTENTLSLEKKYSKSKKENEGKIVLQYSGNVGRVQGLEDIIEAFVLSNNPGIHLVIRGNGALYTAIEKMILIKNLKNITLLGSYSRNEENEVLLNCDISIVSLSKGMFGLGVPSKTYNLLSAGKPILFIGDPNSEISLMVKEFDIGWSIDINKKENLIKFFDDLGSENMHDIQSKGQNARLLAENQFEEKNILAQFQKQMEMNFKN
jgi:glycosyltransferase involved in cell wall biosynthesis